MSHSNEHKLEMVIMEMFEQQEYSYQNGETIHNQLEIKGLERRIPDGIVYVNGIHTHSGDRLMVTEYSYI